jgi:hypothetical protein
MPHSNPETMRDSLTDDPSLVTLVGFPLALVALLVAAGNPLAAVATVATVALVAKCLQVNLAAYARRAGDRIRELDIPGVGTVRFRVVPR